MDVDPPTLADFTRARDAMVSEQIAARGVSDAAVLAAMRTVPRERFVDDGLRAYAYDDAPLPIDEGQTISQPYVVALMCEALGLTAEERVLEVGTGSGYAAAVLGRIAAEVFTIERHPLLAERASARLRANGADNVHVRCGDGTAGWPDAAPFDAIVVAAGGAAVPGPLLEQLAPNGRLVMPVGPTNDEQSLRRLTRLAPDQVRDEVLANVRFVPLVGAEAPHGR